MTGTLDAKRGELSPRLVCLSAQHRCGDRLLGKWRARPSASSGTRSRSRCSRRSRAQTTAARLLRAQFRDLRSEAVAGALSLSSLEVTDTILRW